jgi:hypothetical protein
LADYANARQVKSSHAFARKLQDFQRNVVAANPAANTPQTKRQRPAQRQVLRVQIDQTWVASAQLPADANSG